MRPNILIKQSLSQRNFSFYKVRNWYGNLVKSKQKGPPYNHVVQIGDPTLRIITEPVPEHNITSETVQSVIKQMRKVYDKYDCVGLAAPQVGVPLQILIFGFTKSNMKVYGIEEAKSKEMYLHPLTVVINPSISITDYSKVIFPESCESIKGFWADVPRYRSILVKGFDEKGGNLAIPARGWLARIIQHEMDHLSGKLYTDIMDRKSLTCGCWQIINEHNGKVSLPFG